MENYIGLGVFIVCFIIMIAVVDGSMWDETTRKSASVMYTCVLVVVLAVYIGIIARNTHELVTKCEGRVVVVMGKRHCIIMYIRPDTKE